MIRSFRFELIERHYTFLIKKKEWRKKRRIYLHIGGFMKLLKLLFVLLLVVFFTNSGSAAITGSGHDFSGQTWNTSGEICLPCHTPHNASATYKPLWNHAVTTATYTIYSNGTIQATIGQPDGSSKLCLSCHDGTVALENFGGTTTGTHFLTSADPEYLGNDLSNDHPVSFTYNTALSTSDGELYDPAVKEVGAAGSGTIQNRWLESDKMQCSSCHDVHNTAAIAKMLRKSNSGSALCLTCHNK